MDWLCNGPPPTGGGYPFNNPDSFNPQPYSSRQCDTPSPVSHRSPAQLRTFIARYSDTADSDSVSRSSRPSSVPTTPPQLSEQMALPVSPSTQEFKISSSPLLLTPPASSGHGEDCLRNIDLDITVESPSNSTASSTPPCLLHPPYPRIPSPLSVERLIESEYGKHTIYGITPAMLSDWQIRYPFVREADHINYQYDASTSRLIIRCTVSPVHDSLQIFFQGRVSGALTSRLGLGKFMESVQMSCGSSFGGFTGTQNALSRKQPDASLQIDGYDFPTVVCEAGCAEKMDDLMRDAALWLLHTDGQTSVVLVLAFSEVIGEPQLVNEATNSEDVSEPQPVHDATILVAVPEANLDTAGANPDPAAHDPDAPNGESTDHGTSQAPTIHPAPSSSESSSDDSDIPTEEELLLASVNRTTKPRTLASCFLALHRRGQLAKPLMGRVDATVHVFRPNATHSGIEQTYTAVLLPAPADAEQQVFTLTMADLLGELAEEEGIADGESVEFPLDMLRSVVAKQIPKMESMRAMDRAAGLLKSLGLWEEGETFAQSKRSRKKRRMN